MNKKECQGKTYENKCFDSMNLSGTNFEKAIFHNCTFCNAHLQNVNFESAVFHGCDLSGAHIEGTNFHAATMDDIIIDHVTYDETTRFFEMRCPAEGPLVGYKKCQDDRIVQLLIPADALRSSATLRTCRCSKAKVLSIKNIDETESFDEAISTIDDEFIYRRGEWVYADGFDTNRWHEAVQGIHFWMEREEAIGY